MLSFPMYDHTLVPIYYGPSYIGFGGILLGSKGESEWRPVSGRLGQDLQAARAGRPRS